MKVGTRVSTYYHGYNSSFEQSESLRNNIIQSGFGLEWKSKNLNSQEAYLNAASNNYRNLTDAKAKHKLYSIGYNYFLNFNKNKNTKVIPSVGAGLNLFSEDFKAAYYRGGRSELDVVGAKAMLTPRLLFLPGSRMMIEVSLPITLANLTHGDLLEETEGQITSNQNDFSMEILPNHFSLQLGIGIKL